MFKVENFLGNTKNYVLGTMKFDEEIAVLSKSGGYSEEIFFEIFDNNDHLVRKNTSFFVFETKSELLHFFDDEVPAEAMYIFEKKGLVIYVDGGENGRDEFLEDFDDEYLSDLAYQNLSRDMSYVEYFHSLTEIIDYVGRNRWCADTVMKALCHHGFLEESEEI